MVSPGSQVATRDDSGKPTAWTDGAETWGNHRWPYQAGSNPSYTDRPLTYDPAAHLDRVGSTWWDWEARESVAAVFDIDLQGTKSEGTTTVSEARLAEIVATLSSLPYVTLVRSTGGRGVHGYVFFDASNRPPAANHNEHAKTCQAVLRKVEADTGTDLSSVIDCKGAVLWFWAANAAPGAFLPIKEQTDYLTADDIESYRVDDIPQSIPLDCDPFGLNQYAATVSPIEVAKLLDRLPQVYSDDYQRCVSVGLCVRNLLGDHGYPFWEDFCRRSRKFASGWCESKWATFSKQCDSPLGIGSLRHWVAESETPQPPSDDGDEWETLNLDDLLSGDFTIEFLIDGILVAGQPCLCPGPLKSLKTTTLLYMALCLATGQPFLGRETRRSRVLMLSGESGLATLQDTARRQLATLGECDPDYFRLSAKLPRLDKPLDALERLMLRQGTEVLVVDPAYLCMDGTDAGNMFTMGQQLKNLADLCIRLGVTPILAHHTTKSAGRENKPLDLYDMAWSGFGEFARQWLLISRREAFIDGTGEHRLFLRAGGSAGHSNLLFLDISEGVYPNRYWTIESKTNSEAKAGIKEAKYRSSIEKLREALPKCKNGLNQKEIGEVIGCSNAKAKPMIAEMVARGDLEAFKVSGGNRYQLPTKNSHLIGDMKPCTTPI